MISVIRLSTFLLLGGLFSLTPALAQSTPKSGGSTVLRFESSAQPDTSRALVDVLIREGQQSEPVHGATVLLRRDADKMYGRVTLADGQCHLRVGEGTYIVRVQMTGLVSFEQSNFILEKGKHYTLEIGMAKQ